MSNVLTTIPVHLALQLIITGNQSLESGTSHTVLLQPQLESVLPEGYTAFPDIGVALKYYSDKLTWNSARKYCMSEGGNLAVVDSLEKGRRVNSVRNSQPLAGFIGIHKLFDNSEWVSVTTGASLDFIPWHVGSNLNSLNMSCTILYDAEGGRVIPEDCNKATAYTCEIQIPKYNSGVQPSPTRPTEQSEESDSAISSTATPGGLATLPEGYVDFPDDHAAYKVYRDDVYWEQARKLCIDEGAHLAIPDTVHKIKHIYEMISGFRKWINVGIHRSNTTNDYIRIDNGLPLTSLPWRNPEDSGHCVAISWSGLHLTKFVCDRFPSWYACEIPI